MHKQKKYDTEIDGADHFIGTLAKHYILHLQATKLPSCNITGSVGHSVIYDNAGHLCLRHIVELQAILVKRE